MDTFHPQNADELHDANDDQPAHASVSPVVQAINALENATDTPPVALSSSHTRKSDREKKKDAKDDKPEKLTKDDLENDKEKDDKDKHTLNPAPNHGRK